MNEQNSLMNPRYRRDFFKSSLAGAVAASAAASETFGYDELDVNGDASLLRRQEYLRQLQDLLGTTSSKYRGRINAFDKTWEDWQQRTGELPPDFSQMPSNPFLPDPLVMLDEPSSPISTREQWQQQREWIKQRFQKWIFGTMPPAPDNLQASVMDSRREGDATVQEVQLRFGPDHQAVLTLQLIVPPGDGPFPVFLTNHPRRRPWVNTAVRRGYMACIYYALDWSYGAGDDSDAWVDIYTDYDFSCIARWAWAGMRAVDYLITLPEVNPRQIAISGHSRNSKQALLAAAFDERIAAVVPSRGNTGDQLPWRFNTDQYVSEPLEEITIIPHWFHPRLRFFAGREHQLPVDQNLLLALVAPRALMMSHAYMEHQGNVMAFEQAYRSVREVYKFLGKENRLAMYQQPGEHPSSVLDIERYFDFFDTVFERNQFPLRRDWVHGYSFEQWQKGSDERIDPLEFPQRSTGDFLIDSNGSPISKPADWTSRRQQIVDAIRWSLGEEPPGIPLPSRRQSRGSGPITSGWRGQLFPRLQQHVGGIMGGRAFSFGDDLSGEIYFPVDQETKRPNLAKKAPAVIWLHPYSYAMGYGRYNYWYDLVANGCIVVAFDQIGFGVRNDHALNFYKRYPQWSLMGKMVCDTQAAIEALLQENFVDPSKIALVGYALGAKVALLTAALDDRVKAVSIAGGFSPLRHTEQDGTTEGIQHYSHLHGLLPRWGHFVGEERRLPIDYDEILAAIAPRPVQVLAPTLDRFYPLEDVRLAVDSARKVYEIFDAGDALQLESPIDFARYAKMWKPQVNWTIEQIATA